MERKGKKFCILCGKTEIEKIIVDGFCEDCIKKERKLFEISTEPFSIKVCLNCNEIFSEKKYYNLEKNFHKTIREALSDYFSSGKIKTNSDINLDIQPLLPTNFDDFLEKRKIPVKIRGFGRVDPRLPSYFEEQEVEVKIERIICFRCDKIKRRYYKAILQFRTKKTNITPEEQNEIIETVCQILQKQIKIDRMAYISKIEKNKGGFDIYLGSTSAANLIASTLRDQMGFSMKKSYKKSGVDKSSGKTVYQTTISLRLPIFKIGDIISIEKQDPIQITGVERGKFLGIKLDNLEHISIPIKELWNFQIDVIAEKSSFKDFMILSRTYNSIQLLDMENFEVKEIYTKQLSTDTLKEGLQVKGVEIKNNIYLIQTNDSEGVQSK